MKQFVTLNAPVLKSDDSGDIVEVGDLVRLILNDAARSLVSVYLTDVSTDGKRIGWSLNQPAIDAAITSSQNSTTAASDDTTGNALANALKTSYNAAQVDVATLFRAYDVLGSPTSSQNATTAASDDTTRQALANALKADYNAAQVDIAELFAAKEQLGSPTSSQLATPDGSNDATTQTLLNALKTAYNALQVDIAEAFTKLGYGSFVPRQEDVYGVDGQHQKSYADTNLHDDPYDADSNPRVPLS